MRHRRDSGSALFIATLVVLIVAALAVVVVADAVAKSQDTDLEIENVRALYVAESAIDLAMNDIQNGTGTGRIGTTAWGGGDDVGQDGNGGTMDAGQNDGLPTVGEPDVNLQNFAVASGGEYYTYAMFWGSNGIDDDGDGVLDLMDLEEKYVWSIWAWGRFGNTIRRIKVIAEYHVVSIWDNAIIAGQGAAGKGINGNVKVHGGMLMFAEDAAGNPSSGPGLDYIEFSGGAAVKDNYTGLTASNIARMPPLLPGKKGLNTNVRLQHGRFKLQGSAQLGEDALGDPDDPATIENDQQMVDGVFVTDGFSGSGGAAAVDSENGTGNPWDLPDSVKFPRLTDPYFDPVSGLNFANYDAFVTARGLLIPPTLLTSLNPSGPGNPPTKAPSGQTQNRLDHETPSFSHPTATTPGAVLGGDGKYRDANGNRIEWNTATNTLVIEGIVNIPTGAGSGGDFHIGRNASGDSGDITYDMRGSIYVSGTGNAHFHADILPKDQYLTNDVLGFTAKNNVELATGSGDSQLSMFGIFRAGGTLKSAKQNEIYGVFISEFFDLGTNVPRIAHHPEVTKNLPPGFNADPIPTTLYIQMWGEW